MDNDMRSLMGLPAEAPADSKAAPRKTARRIKIGPGGAVWDAEIPADADINLRSAMGLPAADPHVKESHR